jgi:hypothetical protein
LCFNILFNILLNTLLNILVNTLINTLVDTLVNILVNISIISKKVNLIALHDSYLQGIESLYIQKILILKYLIYNQ